MQTVRRILHICAVDFTVRQFIAPVVLDQRRRGFDARVACAPGPWWEELQRRDVPLHPLPISRRADPWQLIRATADLVRLLRRERIDVLHVHTPVAAMVGRLAGKMAGTSVVLHTVHGYYFHDRMAGWKRRAHVALERVASRGQDGLLCVSHEDLRTARREGLLPHSGLATWVGNGVDTERFDPVRMKDARERVRAELGIPPEAFTIVSTGRITREKGIPELLRAVSRIPEAHLIQAGGRLESERDNIEPLLDRANRSRALAGRLHLTGFRDDIPELLGAADLFVLASHREGLPVSLLEAMAMGLPAIATNIRGCREALRDGETGFLFEPGDVSALRGAIRFLQARPELRQRFGNAARERVLEHFAEREVLDRHHAFLERVLRSHQLADGTGR